MRAAPVLIPVFVAIVLVIPNGAHDVITTKLTYSRDISRIFLKRCTSCHGNGSSIPLTSYQQVRPWAVDIKEQVLDRQMPPWGAVKGFGDLAPDRGLTEEELLMVAAWVVGGAPEGNPALLPAAAAAEQAVQLAPLREGLHVNRSRKLDRSFLLAGIRPEPVAELTSARIVAQLPNGRTLPLVWLFHYDPKWRQAFRFRAPISLPAGSVVEADAPAQFVLETP
ncbi:MAG TPA: cytochrome c [Bryobacteraceae bacterium]|jgi:hypothetical protein|nr:cytochrome c [Bryobacteraceae bacterium]